MGLRLTLVRHGAAGDRELFKALGKDDEHRPLEPKGEKDVARVALSLRRILKSADIIASSPLVRATQTADILAGQFSEAKRLVINELRPDAKPTELLHWLRGLSRAKDIVLVGHEPHLGRCLSYLLTGNSSHTFDIKKGGFAILEFPGQIVLKDAKLKCFLQPSQLKKIRKR